MSRPLSKAARQFADQAQRPPRFTDDFLDQLRAGLSNRTREVAVSLLGAPNEKMSSKDKLRFGSKGSIKVALKGEHCGLFYDFADKTSHDPIAFIQRQRGCDFVEAVEIATAFVGGEFSSRQENRPKTSSRDELSGRHDNPDYHTPIWNASADPRGTPVEQYLAGRRLGLDDACAIRFHPACPFKGERVPAMIALLQDIRSGEPCGIHRTALLSDGSDRDRARGKAMLGRAKSAAIMLSPFETVETSLFVAEGVESGIAMLNFGFAPVWALGSAGSIHTFPVLAGIEVLTMAVDHDPAGESAAVECGQRWHGAGREVRFMKSPVDGEDIADIAARCA